MATIVQQAYTDFAALRLNGTNQDAWKRNPSFKDASVGTFAMWVRFPVVITGNGQIAIRTLGNAGAADYMWFNLRSNNAFDKPVNVIERVSSFGGAIKQKCGSTTLAANAWYFVGGDSDGDLWVNGAKETPKYWRNTGERNPGYYNTLPGTTKDLSYGTTRYNGIIGGYYRVDVNDSYEFNSVLTSTEWAYIYSRGMGSDPNTWTPSGLTGKIINCIDFENRATPFIGSDGLTLTNSPSYITP